MMTIAFEAKQQLAVGDFFYFGRTGTKGRFQILFKQIVGLAHMAVEIDDAYFILWHAHLRSRSVFSTPLMSTLLVCIQAN
jgi:hypothetical protein